MAKAPLRQASRLHPGTCSFAYNICWAAATHFGAGLGSPAACRLLWSSLWLRQSTHCRAAALAPTLSWRIVQLAVGSVVGGCRALEVPVWQGAWRGGQRPWEAGRSEGTRACTVEQPPRLDPRCTAAG